MKQVLELENDGRIVMLADEIEYGRRADWGGITQRPLKLSLMRTRQYFPCDTPEKMPVIVWLCGGGFTSMDRNVWAPELYFFAKNGWAVASVEYSVDARTRFPQQIVDVKQAIRFLRANAEEFNLDPERFAVMGESAGGYMAALVGATGETAEYDNGIYPGYSSAVKAAVPWYCAATPAEMEVPKFLENDVPPDLHQYADVCALVNEKTPPYLLLHGDEDSQVPQEHSEKLYEVLQKAGVPADLYIFKGAEHADAPFVHPKTKQIILDFLNKYV